METTRKLDRRIEKVISFDNDESDQLKREITEYVATDNIETNLERMFSMLDEGLGGGAGEVGVWVSGFYGSGKSSFTKYLGFALDPERTIDGKPFLDWLQAQLKSKALRTQLATLAKKHPATVIMLDLASAQIADYLAEALHFLSKKVNRYDYVSSHCKFGRALQGRDEAAIKKTVCALIKLLRPKGQPLPTELSEYVAYAIEGRRRVKEQMNKRKADDEFGLINLSYFDEANREIVVFLPRVKRSPRNPESAAQNAHWFPTAQCRYFYLHPPGRVGGACCRDALAGR